MWSVFASRNLTVQHFMKNNFTIPILLNRKEHEGSSTCTSEYFSER